MLFALCMQGIFCVEAEYFIKKKTVFSIFPLAFLFCLGIIHLALGVSEC